MWIASCASRRAQPRALARLVPARICATGEPRRASKSTLSHTKHLANQIEQTNPWDELFATESSADGSDSSWISDWGAALDRDSSCRPEHALKEGEFPWKVHKAQYRREPSLTKAESHQFRRIFDILAQEKSPDIPIDRPLGMFASRNKLASDSVLIRGGGLGKRFEELRDGIASHISVAEMDAHTDRIWSELFELQSANEVWCWTETNVWADSARYGVSTPLYAPALHLVFLALRDRFRAPHAALAVYHHTRTQGEEAFMLGCTVSMFAEAIRTSWMCFRDAQGVLYYVNEARRVGLLSRERPQKAERQIATRIELIRKEMRDMALRMQLPTADSGQLGLTAAAHDLLRIERAIGFKNPARPSAPRPRATERRKGPKQDLFILPAFEGLVRERINRK